MVTGPLLTSDIRAAFAEEVAALGGTVSDVFEDGSLLLARSIFPWIEEVHRADRVQGGIALRFDGQDVFVHPYVFRLVCKNGCIVAHALQSRHIASSDFPTIEEATDAIRDAIRGCGVREAFSAVAGRMRTAQEVQADHALSLLPRLRRLSGAHGSRLAREVMQRFIEGGDRTRFGLLNAVTSVARDTRDPEMRWRLEEFGGGMLVGSPRGPESDDSGAGVTERSSSRLHRMAERGVVGCASPGTATRRS